MLDKQKNEGVPKPYLANANVQWGQFELSDVRTMPFCNDELEKFKLRPGDLMICEGGVPGRCAIWDSDDEMYYQKALHRIRCDSSVLLVHYCCLVINLLVNSHALDDDFTGTTIKHLPARVLERWKLPLPPIAEQHRILDRAKRLLVLVCEYDTLESARERLDAELPGRLRKSILQQAVQGKLAPQDPADEPASVLLERIRAERRQLVAEGKLKAPKGGESVIWRASDGGYYEKRLDKNGKQVGEAVRIDDEIPFEIPDSWEWARLGGVATFAGGGTPDRNNPQYWNGKTPWASMKDIHGEFLYGTIDTITEEGLASKPSISIAKPGQLIVSTRLTPGKTIISKIECAINQDLKTVCSPIPVQYLSIWFESHLEYFKRFSTGTTVPGIKLQDLENALISIPPVGEMDRLSTLVKSLLDPFYQSIVSSTAMRCSEAVRRK